MKVPNCDALIKSEWVIKEEAPLVDCIRGRKVSSQSCSIAGNHGAAQHVVSDAAPAPPAECLTHTANRLIADDHLKRAFTAALERNKLAIDVHLTDIKQRFDALSRPSEQRALAAYILNKKTVDSYCRYHLLRLVQGLRPV